MHQRDLLKNLTLMFVLSRDKMQVINQGLRTIYNYWTRAGYHPLGKGTVYESKSYSFTKTTTDDFMYIDYIAQIEKVRKAWTTFIHENSKSFTIAGVERINKSITIYCSAILGSHSQIRKDIFGTWTAFDARKQFLANIEDAINSRIFRTSQKQQIKNQHQK